MKEMELLLKIYSYLKHNDHRLSEKFFQFIENYDETLFILNLLKSDAELGLNGEWNNDYKEGWTAQIEMINNILNRKVE